MTIPPDATIHLVDASPYLFRAFFSVPKTLVDPDGRPVNAVYGFASFLAKYIADERPTHIAVAFDRHFNQSFRNAYYPAYKAHREKSPPELDAQVDPARDSVEAMGVTTFIHETHEADDIIATVMHRVPARYVIVTSDKDLTQLVTERAIVVDPARKLRFDAAGVEAKFGVRPDQITDYLALTGDAVDNIPGVRGIGAKSAAALLQRYGSLEKIYENVPAMKRSAIRGEGSLGLKLEKDVSNAGLSKRLATVAIDTPIDVDPDQLAYRGVYPPKAMVSIRRSSSSDKSKSSTSRS
jgi:DNA polymerase-1